MNRFKYIQESVDILEKISAEFGVEAIGSTIEEVNELEQMLNPTYKLPASVKEFLLYSGKRMIGYSHLEKGPCERFKFWCDYKTKEEICEPLFDEEGSNAELLAEIFLVDEHLGSTFAYLKLTEGEDPPIYMWDESDGGGLETVKQCCSSFSELLKLRIRSNLIFLMGRVTMQKIDEKKPPRGQQLWVPTCSEFREGIPRKTLRNYFGIVPQDFQKITTFVGLDLDSYLEELSGWKCRKVYEDDNEVRFFPPEA